MIEMIPFLIGALAGCCIALGLWAWQDRGKPTGSYVDARPQVVAFANLMERTLRRNDYKGGWEKCDNEWVYDKLDEEVSEFKVELLRTDGSADSLIGEATDVACVALIALDNNGLLA